MYLSTIIKVFIKPSRLWLWHRAEDGPLDIHGVEHLEGIDEVRGEMHLCQLKSWCKHRARKKVKVTEMKSKGGFIEVIFSNVLSSEQHSAFRFPQNEHIAFQSDPFKLTLYPDDL